MNITIIGEGAFGNAMRHVLRQNNDRVKFAKWGHVVQDSEIVVLCVPTQAIRDVLPLISFPTDTKIIINTAKGIEQKTHKFPYQIAEEFFGDDVEYYSLMGPSFAGEVIKDMPTLVNIGFRKHVPHKTIVKKLFHTDYFHVRLTEGVEVLEIASAMKNVYAIGCGIAEGLGYKENTKAKLLTLAIEEMQRLFTALHFTADDNATPGTIGDLIMACATRESRNFRFGRYLVDNTPDEALAKINSTVEGYNSLLSMHRLQNQAQVQLPFASFIATIALGKDKSIRTKFEQFMKET